MDNDGRSSENQAAPKLADTSCSAIVQQVRHPYLVVDTTGIILHINEAAASLLGAVGSSCVGRPVTAFLDPDPAALFAGHLVKLVVSAKEPTLWLSTPGGDIFFYMVPAKTPGDRIIHIFCHRLPHSSPSLRYPGLDQALAESEDRFAKAFRANPAPMVISEIRSGRFIDVNTRWETMLGYPKKELIGRTSKEVGIWDEPEKRDQAVAIFKREGNIRDFPITFRTRAGETRRALWSAEKMVFGGREVLLSLIHDYTERQQAEDILRESEEKFSLAFDASPDAININRLDDGLYVNINRGFTDLTGFTREDVQGKTSTHINIWCDLEDRRELVRRLQEDGYCENLEARFCRKDGTITTGLMSARVIHLNGIPHILSITRDISRQIDMEKQLHQARKMEALGRLTGGVAHDFNNLLGVILGNTDLAIKEAAADTSIYRTLCRIRDAAQRSTDITRQLLTFSRQQPISPQLISFNQAMDGMLGLLRQMVGTEIIIDWRADPQLPPVRMDPAQVNQLLVNLCVNAGDAIDGRGTIVIESRRVHFDEEACRVRVGVSPGEFVLLSVSDDGCGIDEDILPQIFEPFFTTKEQGKGTGLGLATVYGVVKQNGGFIDVVSSPEEGTTFSIYLPAAPVAGEEFTKEGMRKR